MPSLAYAKCGLDTGTACPSPDVDGDGYTTNGTKLGYDCDDTDWQITPGVWRKVASDYSYCQTNGTWSTGVSTPDASTGSGVDYFIDCDAGSNGGGTHGSPWNIASYVTSQYSGTPSGRIDLNAGDAVWIGGTCTTQIDEDGVGGGVAYLFLIRNRDANSTDKIKILTWPGKARAKFNNTGADLSTIVHIQNSDYVELHGIEVQGGGDYGVHYSDSTGGLIKNAYVHDVDGVADNNNTGITFTQANNTYLTHSLLEDNWDNDSVVTKLNNRNFAAFGGTGNKVLYSSFDFDDAAIIGATGEARQIGYKHGDTVTTSSSAFEAAYNIILDGAMGVETGESGSNIHHNYIEVRATGLSLEDIGGPFYPNNFLAEYNTIKADSCYNFDWDSADSTPTNNIVKKNVCTNNVASYNSEQGTQVHSVYGNDALYTTVSSLSVIDFQQNCYYNAGAAALQFNFFSSDSGANNKGELYSFANWKLADTSGTNNKPIFDDDSFSENPSFDSLNRATSTNCKNFGWMLDAPAEEEELDIRIWGSLHDLLARRFW